MNIQFKAKNNPRVIAIQKIYGKFYNKEEDFEPKIYFDELRKNIKSIKYKLGNALKLKYMPKIKFILSEDYSHYDKINRMLKNDG